MKAMTHYIAIAIGAVTTILCLPGVHNYLMTLTSHDSYLATIIPALLTLAALYHNPKNSN